MPCIGWPVWLTSENCLCTQVCSASSFRMVFRLIQPCNVTHNCRQYSKAYVSDEAEARHAQQGIWKGAFEVPADWRKEHKNNSTAKKVHASMQGPSLKKGRSPKLPPQLRHCRALCLCLADHIHFNPHQIIGSNKHQVMTQAMDGTHSYIVLLYTDVYI